MKKDLKREWKEWMGLGLGAALGAFTIACSHVDKKVEVTELNAVGVPVASASDKPTARERPDFKMLHFGFDADEIQASQQSPLKENLERLQARSEMAVTIEGHCDKRGSDAYNMRLGKRRAESVRRYLLAHGIASNRIATVSYGKSRLLDHQDTEEAHALNRRVGMVVKGKLIPIRLLELGQATPKITVAGSN